jgi:hypothetical protein
MKNLFDGLRNAGLSDLQAKKSIEVVYEWVEERYPVLAAVARETVTKEMTAAPGEIEDSRMMESQV